MMVKTIASLLLAVLLLSPTKRLVSDFGEDNSWRAQASPAEIELVGVVQTLHSKYDNVYEAMEQIDDPYKEREYFKAHDPAQEAIPKLLANRTIAPYRNPTSADPFQSPYLQEMALEIFRSKNPKSDYQKIQIRTNSLNRLKTC